MANPSDNTYAIVRNTSVGVIPATPGFINIDNNTNIDLKLDSKDLTPETMRQNRALTGMRKTGFSASGTIKSEFRRDNGMDKLLESALSGVADGDGLIKAGNTDTYHTIESTMYQNGSPLRQRFTDMMAKKFDLTVDAESFAQATYDLVGTGRIDAAPLIMGATYTAPTQGIQMIGSDLHSIVVGGLTAVYQSLQLTVEHTRDPVMQLGSNFAADIGTSKNRTVTLTVKLYRTDFSPETLCVPDTPFPVSFNVGAVGYGYGFTLPAVVGSIPTNDSSGSKEMVTIKMTAVDVGAGYDISVGKL